MGSATARRSCLPSSGEAPRSPGASTSLQCLVTRAGPEIVRARLGGVWVLEKLHLHPSRRCLGPLGLPRPSSLAVWTPGRGAVCRLDGMSPLAYVRKIASTPSTLPRYGGRGHNLEISMPLGTFGGVVRVETWGCSRSITSRETVYIIPRPIHWASSTSCPLDRHHNPPDHPARVKTSPAAAPFSWHSRQAAHQQGHGPTPIARPGHFR